MHMIESYSSIKKKKSSQRKTSILALTSAVKRFKHTPAWISLRRVSRLGVRSRLLNFKKVHASDWRIENH